MDRVKRETIFIDIDGTLVRHKGSLEFMIKEPLDVLPNTLSKLNEWRNQDHYIVLTTARPRGLRSRLEQQLSEAGIFYDELIMGLPVGPRTVINDEKPNGLKTAKAICIKRNSGIADIKL